MMASFRKHGPSWQFTINNYVDGKRRPIIKSGFKTKKEAQVAAAEIEASLNKGIQTIVKNKAFSEYFSEWVELYKANRHVNTYDRYKNSVARVKEHFKDKPIQSITRTEYQLFLNEYGIGKSRETVRKLNTHIRGCVRDAIEDGYIAVDFTRKAEIHGELAPKKSIDKHLSYTDSTRLYNELVQRLSTTTSTYHLLLLALVSGLRFGELVGLTTESFDFKANQLHITKAWDYKRGTGFSSLKNTQSERKISVDPRVMSAFKKLLVALPANTNDLVFYRQSVIKTITNEGANKVLKKVLTDLSINPITVHGLRHTHASVLLYKGANIHSVSKRLGHVDIQTTLDHYAHVLKEMEERDESIAISIYSS